MSVIPASRLSSSDLARLGNNLRPRKRQPMSRRRIERRLVATVNRSLACVGEAVSQFETRPIVVVA
jgi:hypothetical protein